MSGFMLGLGEERLEVHQVMDDMRCAGIDFLTMGQYLQPTPKHAKVVDFVSPKGFEAYGAIARAKGFLQVAASRTPTSARCALPARPSWPRPRGKPHARHP